MGLAGLNSCGGSSKERTSVGGDSLGTDDIRDVEESGDGAAQDESGVDGSVPDGDVQHDGRPLDLDTALPDESGTVDVDLATDLDPGNCDAAGGPIPYVPGEEYLALCMREECWTGVYIDPAPVSFGPYQIEWTMSAVNPLPPCVEPHDNLLIVRTKWRNVFGDLPGASAMSDLPCGGMCLPSSGKVYLVDTTTDSVRYLGDEDPGGWGAAILPEAVNGGWKLQVSPTKDYVFHRSGCGMGTMDGLPYILGWAACVVEIKNTACLHFPMRADPGPCPVDQIDYVMDGGKCSTW